MTHEHDRDDQGRCKACLRYGEKLSLIEKAQKTNDTTEREVLLERVRSL